MLFLAANIFVSNTLRQISSAATGRRKCCLALCVLERSSGCSQRVSFMTSSPLLLWQRMPKKNEEVFVGLRFFVTALVTRDRQRDVCGWHLWLSTTTLITGSRRRWFTADIPSSMLSQMKMFNVSPTERYLSRISDWRIKLYLFTPEFNFMSDKSNHKHSFFLSTEIWRRRSWRRKRRMEKNPKSPCGMFFSSSSRSLLWYDARPWDLDWKIL